MDLLELAERVERAKGADPMLDRAVLRHAIKEAVWDIAPAYTASLDAAMTLVPEGCLSMARTLWDEDKTAGNANVSRYVRHENGGLYFDWDWSGTAATPALALTAAALRARATQ